MSICLGLRTGAKAKRPQVVILRSHTHRPLIRLLRFLRAATRPGDKLIPYSISGYRSELRLIESELGVTVGWTPHSPRAGYASESKAGGVPFEEIREGGRWLADSILSIYIDVVQAAQVAAPLRTSGLAPSLRYASAWWDVYLAKALGARI